MTGDSSRRAVVMMSGSKGGALRHSLRQHYFVQGASTGGNEDGTGGSLKRYMTSIGRGALGGAPVCMHGVFVRRCGRWRWDRLQSHRQARIEYPGQECQAK